MLDRGFRLLTPESGSQRMDPAGLQAAGDEARDRKDWPAAAAGYEAYLRERPEDAPIWVQLGHARKEQGLLEEAVAAYRRAVALQPGEVDGHLQLGRALRLAGREGEAVEALRTALESGPSAEAYRELSLLGQGELAMELMASWEDSVTDATLYDVSDLLGYLRAHQTLSGIQRVQANIIEQILLSPAGATGRHRFVMSADRTPSEPVLLVLPSDGLLRMLRYATGRAVQHARLRSLVDDVEALAVPLVPRAGQTLMILGAFWGLRQVIGNARRLREEGLRIGVYIYDLIPVTHPEFCDWALTFHFGMSLGDALPCFDFVLTISEHVAQEVRTVLGRAGLSHTPVQAVPLAHVLKASEVRRRDLWTPAISVLKDVPFVLVVSTIEARKNHAYLFRLWREMLAAGEDVPDLVFVGRPGWRVDDLMAQLRDTGYLDGKLHILHDLTDDELSTLYRHCLFTAFPSFVEGWGLPVGESLAHGAPCVASSSSSIPEVGGDLVDYIDPLNLRDGLATVRKLLFEPGCLDQRREEIARRFRPRSWAMVTEDLLRAIARLSPARPTSPDAVVPRWDAGRFFRPNELLPRLGRILPADYLTCPSRLMLGHGWYECEGFGVWMRGEEAQLSFRTPLSEGEEIVVYLQMAGAPQVDGHVLTARSQKGRRNTRGGSDLSERRMFTTPNATATLRVHARVGREGVAHLYLELDRPALPPGEGDRRRFAVGLVSLCWTRVDDLPARQEVVETLLLG